MLLILFRILGVLSLLVTLMFLLISALTEGINGQEIGLLAWSAGWTILWFCLAHWRARRLRMLRDIAMKMPCGHCGSEASSGYRVCGSCGRVKDPVLR